MKHLRKEDVFFNARTRYYIDEHGNEKWYDTLIANQPLFNPDKVELSHKSYSKKLPKLQGHYECPDGVVTSADVVFVPDPIPETVTDMPTGDNSENIERSARRARQKLFELAVCNPDMDVFVTLTIDPKHSMKTSYEDLVHTLKDWLSNRVKRFGLKYVLVPEVHKDGTYHLHGLFNRALSIVDSGTVLVPTYSKPIKRETARRNKIPPELWQTVYNLPDWSFGFTTAMIVTDRPNTDDHIAACAYVSKYITKGQEKIGGRWYLSGGRLQRLKEIYYNATLQTPDPNNDFKESEFQICNTKFYKAKPNKL